MRRALACFAAGVVAGVVLAGLELEVRDLLGREDNLRGGWS